MVMLCYIHMLTMKGFDGGVGAGRIFGVMSSVDDQEHWVTKCQVRQAAIGRNPALCDPDFRVGCLKSVITWGGEEHNAMDSDSSKGCRRSQGD
jgi:hypothetical protein